MVYSGELVHRQETAYGPASSPLKECLGSELSMFGSGGARFRLTE